MEKKNEQKQEKTELDFNDKIETTYKSLKDFVSLKLEQLKDLATLEIMLPIETRLRERVKSIQKISQARSLKINRHWKTIPPQIHIRNLEAKKLSNNEGVITFEVYETDDKGNKKLYENRSKIELHDGSKITRVTSADYHIAYEVTESIQKNKPVKREIFKIEPLEAN